MKHIDFEDAGRIRHGVAVTVHLHSQRLSRAGTFMGTLPGKENGTVRDRSDAIVLRSGALITYYRADDVKCIEVDGRHLTKEAA
jgi:hypothetical protein